MANDSLLYKSTGGWELKELDYWCLHCILWSGDCWSNFQFQKMPQAKFHQISTDWGQEPPPSPDRLCECVVPTLWDLTATQLLHTPWYFWPSTDDICAIVVLLETGLHAHKIDQTCLAQYLCMAACLGCIFQGAGQPFFVAFIYHRASYMSRSFCDFSSVDFARGESRISFKQNSKSTQSPEDYHCDVLTESCYRVYA